MHSINWRKEILTVPNMLSILRLFLLPFYISLYLNAQSKEQYAAAAFLMILSCITDLLDGRIARKYGMISNLGKLLDPVADKATQFTLIACFCEKYKVMRPVMVLFLVKEAFQLAAFIIAFRMGKTLSGALPAGKICTTVLFISLICMAVFSSLPAMVINMIAAADIVFLGISFFSYILAYYGKDKKLEDFQL